MNLQEIIAGGGGLLLALLTLIQITPIKLNPWSAIAKAVGKAINQDLASRVDALGSKVDSLETGLQRIRAESAEHEVIACRIRILRFGDEVLHGIQHSKDHFDQILMDITEYDHYCIAHPDFKNNMTELTSQRIKETYAERLEKNDFL